MDPLYLYVEYRIRIDFYLHAVCNILCKSLFVLSLDSHELFEERAVLCVFFEFLDLFKICLPVGSYALVDKTRQTRIGLHHESAVAYSVCLVVEFVRLQLIELAEYSLCKDITVQSRYSVYRMASDNGQIGHLYLIIPKRRCLAAQRMPVISFKRKALLPALVYLIYYHVDPRQELLEVRDRPLLKSLRQNSVVRERSRCPYYLPCVFPLESFLIDEHSHEFRDAHGRMCIVYVDLYPVSELIPLLCSITGFVLPDYHADSCGNEEVLLSETELLADTVCIIRIKDTGKSLYLAALFHRLAVVAGIECVHVNSVVHRLSIP